MDYCGTGGDKSFNFNISTTAAFVLAGGGFICKHCNRSILLNRVLQMSLQALGINLTSTPAEPVGLW